MAVLPRNNYIGGTKEIRDEQKRKSNIYHHRNYNLHCIHCFITPTLVAQNIDMVGSWNGGVYELFSQLNLTEKEK